MEAHYQLLLCFLPELAHDRRRLYPTAKHKAFNQYN